MLGALASGASAAPPQIAAKQAEAQRILEQVQALDSKVEKAIESYNAATIRLQGIEKDLATNTRELVVAQSNLDKAQAYLKKRLRDLYTSDQKNTDLEVLLGSASLDEVIDRLDTEDRVSAEDSRILGEVIKFRAVVKRQRIVLRTARTNQAKVVATRSEQKRWIEGQLAERQRMLDARQHRTVRRRPARCARRTCVGVRRAA